MAFGISRATNPQEFFDVTSQLLLIKPEPQYLHARLILSALSMKLGDGGMDLGLPIDGRDLPGGVTDNYLGLDQMQFDLSDPIAEAAIRVVPDFNSPMYKQPGHVVRFNRPKFQDTTYTMASRHVAPGATISTTPMNVLSEQVPLEVKRWAGPYDPNQSAVAPLGIDRFDAGRALHSFSTIAELHFTRDFHKTVDAFGVGLWNSVQSANVIYPDGMTADNDALTAGSFPMDYATIAKASRTLDLLSIPYFPNGRRIAVLTVLQCEQLTRDPEYQRLAVFEKDFNPLFKGSYVGSIGQVDILKSVTLTTSSNSSSVAVQYGQMFGPGMVGVGPADMPRVVPNTQDNYGENSLAIWLWYCAFGVLDDSFGLSVRTA